MRLDKRTEVAAQAQRMLKDPRFVDGQADIMLVEDMLAADEDAAVGS